MLSLRWKYHRKKPSKARRALIKVFAREPTREDLARQRHVRPHKALLHGRLTALLEQLVHLLHGLGLLGRLAKSEVARAATPARVRKVLDVPKSSDGRSHEAYGQMGQN